MYSKTFLTMCPACSTAERFPRTDLHSVVTCTKCYARFLAEENYVDIEIDDTLVSEQMIVEEAALHFEPFQEGITTKDAKEASKNLDKRTCYGKEQGASVEWMVVSSRGVQEGKSLFNAEIAALKGSVRVNSFGTQDLHKDESVQLNLVKGSTEVSLTEMGWRNELRKLQGDSKLKKKDTQSSATWGIGIRPFREKLQVNSYSPSRESGLLKRKKLQFQKEKNRVEKSKRIAVKNYRRKRGKKGGSEGSQSYTFSDGDVFEGNTTTATTAGASSMLFSDKVSEEFKNFIKFEIKRQVLEGLSEASTSMVKEIEVVEIEELLPQSLNINCGSVSDKQEFTAQVKLLTTILFPITLKAGESSPIKSPDRSKTRENLANFLECKEGTEEKEQVLEKLEFEDLRDAEPTENVKTKLCAMLTKDEKLSAYEPLLEHGDVNVPDSEYYDFAFNRNDDQFAPEQIWAVYDPGSMPRNYLQIKSIASIKPFQLHVSVLEPVWLSESGNPLSCGEFSTDSRITIMKEINKFSHLVRWRRDQNGMIHIYPGEKEVWALYKDWKEFSQEKRIKLGYDIVQVASVEGDWTVNVIPLLKHKGTKTVFQRKAKELFQIHKKDFDRFSHQIPTFEIMGRGGVEGFMELDPAAIPFE